MKISDALSQARRELDSKGVGSSGIDSVILLSHTLFVSKEKVIFNPELELDESQEKSFFELVRRRANREPVSHLIARREFYGRDFLVTKDVLDPRPDSEILIETVLKNFPDKAQKLKILELGVGSGCLIITLLKIYSQAVGTGVDISAAALEISKKNSQTHETNDRLELKKSDLFSALSGEKFDLIISNPPYIPSAYIEKLEPEVRLHEPRAALDGGVSGLDFYERIAKEAANFLQRSGAVFLEIGIGQKDEIVNFFNKNNFDFISCERDLAGIDRVLHFRVR